MMSLFNIWTVARYEIKTLARSWFFRIFTGIGLLILTLVTIFVLTMPYSPYPFRALSSSIPFIILKLLNLFQTIILVFLAADFLKRDRKVDSTEVFYARSMNNSDYIFGKVLGILCVFFAMNLLIAGVAAMIHLFFAPQNFLIQHYFQYFGYISLPNLIFTIGLTLLLMALIRNQAITFILMLAYFGVVVFYLRDKFNAIFDFLGFHIPTGFSDLAGLSVFNTFYLQRFSYLALGLVFIFFTILLFKRLSQSRPTQAISLVLGCLFFVLATIGFVSRHASFSAKTLAREAQRTRNEKYAHFPVIKIDSVNLAVSPKGDTFSAVAKLDFTNPETRPMAQILLSLNPGLEVSQISQAGKLLAFQRDGQQLLVKPNRPIKARSSGSLEIRYAGNIDENYMYLEVPDTTRNQTFNFWLFNIEKRHAFVSEQILLLTPEANWYPIAGLPFGSTHPQSKPKCFTKFRLEVTAPVAKTVISQGKVTTDTTAQKAVHFTFQPKNKLPGISLIVGDYETREIVVDSVRYALMTWKDHAYFEPHFDAIGDTVAAIIRETRNEFESYLNLSYPFSQVILVESPVHFFNYARPWRLSKESVQPELIFLPELGVFSDGANIRQILRFSERRNQRSGQTFSPQETQAQMFMRFITANITGLGGRGRFFLSRLGISEFDSKITPNYFGLVNHVQADEMPIFNMALEAYIQNRLPEDYSSFGRMITGLSEREKCNLALDQKSLAALLADPSQQDLHTALIRYKGDYFFRQMEAQLGQEAFETFLNQILVENRFKTISIDRFVNSMKQTFNLDVSGTLTEWYSDSLLPGYKFSKLSLDKIMAEERTRYQAKLVIENPTARAGLVELKFQNRPRGPRFMREEPTDLAVRLVSLKPNETKELGFVLDEAPRMLEINTFISKNIPTVFRHRFNRDLELNEKIKPFDGERVLEEPAPERKLEIIIDNEDPGFEILTTGNKSILQKLLGASDDEAVKYKGIRPWHPPATWQATTNEDFYGKFIHSAYAIKAGDGQQKVAWNTLIPEPGQYEIYYYADTPEEFRRFRGRRGRRGERGSLHFLIEHDDGTDPAELNLNDIPEDWNYIGTYYFSKDSTRVILTNESKANLVYADAVKWVKK